jgi:UDP-N-acetylmuramoylalanine--D-glutamate ligase
MLRLGGGDLLPRDDLRLLGDHNAANALAASLAVHEAGIGPGPIAEGLRSFRALPHRLEPVREVDGVLWINDSKATNIASTVVAVAAMDRPFVLLLGGRHKGEPYTRLGPLLSERCRLVVAYGEAGPLVEQDLAGQDVPIARGSTFEDVVGRARKAARRGYAVLLSPACSSYDMFKNYEERGATFVKLVGEM